MKLEHPEHNDQSTDLPQAPAAESSDTASAPAAQEPATPSAAQPADSPKSRDKKPVVIYIMILFIAAFLLMTLSFFMHQRSNTEVLGELQDSVNAMQAVQQTQEKVIELQEELSDTQDQLDALQAEKDASDEALLAANRELDAMIGLYSLQQSYLTEDYDTCRNILQSMEDQGLPELLPDEEPSGATAPSLRYQQLKEAILNQ